MNNNLVTLVVPAYNHEHYIEECLESVVNQDYPNMEILIINDGSTDGTGRKIEDFISECKRDIKYISKDNEGLIKTLNLALKEGSGKYFCQIASDDKLLPGSVTNRVRFLEDNPDVDAVFAKSKHIGQEGRIKKNKEPFDEQKNNLADVISGKVSIMFPTGMFKRKTLINLGSFDEDFRFYEDLYMKYLLVLESKVGYLNETVMEYRRHDTNVSKVQSIKLRQEKVLSIEKILEKVDDKVLKKEVEHCLFNEYLKYIKVAGSLAEGRDKIQEILNKLRLIRPFSLRLYYRWFRFIARV